MRLHKAPWKSWNGLFDVEMKLSDLILLPASSHIDPAGRLIYTHPASEIAKNKWRGLAKAHADAAKLAVQKDKVAFPEHVAWAVRPLKSGGMETGYHRVVVSSRWPDKESKIGVIQTHTDPGAGVDRTAFAAACDKLWWDVLGWLENYPQFFDEGLRIDMPRPEALVGSGMTDEEIGVMMSEKLPDCVRVWEMGEIAPIW